jgi:hypothetical protein
MHSQWDRARVDFLQPGVRGMHYDGCAFNFERISGDFGSLSDRIHARAPHVKTIHSHEPAEMIVRSADVDHLRQTRERLIERAR